MFTFFKLFRDLGNGTGEMSDEAQVICSTIVVLEEHMRNLLINNGEE